MPKTAYAGQPSRRIYSRDQLLDLMHHDMRDETDRVVHSHIGNLRRTLDNLAPDQPLIHAVYGAGYRFEMIKG